MKYSIIVSAALAVMALSACDRQPVVAVPVPVAVPGPAGAPGATGATGSTGSTGDTGATGKTGGNTVVIIPAAPASSN